jgi:hypothetical protein
MLRLVGLDRRGEGIETTIAGDPLGERLAHPRAHGVGLAAGDGGGARIDEVLVERDGESLLRHGPILKTAHDTRTKCLRS